MRVMRKDFMKPLGTIACVATAVMLSLGFLYVGFTHEFTPNLVVGFAITLWILAVIAVGAGLIRIPPLYDMSREFWHAVGLVLFICAIAVPITGWFLRLGNSFAFATFWGCAVGVAVALQLGNGSDSLKDRSR